MMAFLKRFGLVTAALLTLTIGFAATPASAAPSANTMKPAAGVPGMPPCNLTDFVDRYTAGGGGLAELDLYWDPAHQTDCAEMVHLGAAYGQVGLTDVEIYTCATDTAGQTCNFISKSAPYHGDDYGEYAYEAGPASVAGGGHCVYVAGSLIFNRVTYQIVSEPNTEASHC